MITGDLGGTGFASVSVGLAAGTHWHGQCHPEGGIKGYPGGTGCASVSVGLAAGTHWHGQCHPEGGIKGYPGGTGCASAGVTEKHRLDAHGAAKARERIAAALINAVFLCEHRAGTLKSAQSVGLPAIDSPAPWVSPGWGSTMVAFLLGGCAVGILPLLLLVWLLHKPVDLPWKAFFARAVPRVRLRAMRLNVLMIVVFVVALDAAFVVSGVPKEIAFVLIAADLAVIGGVFLFASCFALTPAQIMGIIVLLAFIAMVVASPFIRVFVL